jgi:hypothetical protein
MASSRGPVGAVQVGQRLFTAAIAATSVAVCPLILFGFTSPVQFVLFRPLFWLSLAVPLVGPVVPERRLTGDGACP